MAVNVTTPFPETERPVAGGQLGRNRQAAALEIEQHFAPGLGALPVAVGDRQHLLACYLAWVFDAERRANLLILLELKWSQFGAEQHS